MVMSTLSLFVTPPPPPPPFSNLDVDLADQCVNYSKIPSESRMSQGPRVVSLFSFSLVVLSSAPLISFKTKR